MTMASLYITSSFMWQAILTSTVGCCEGWVEGSPEGWPVGQVVGYDVGVEVGRTDGCTTHRNTLTEGSVVGKG